MDSNDEAQNVIELKVVLVGKSGVGKTSIVNVTLNDSFSDSNIPTVGATFSLKTLTYKNQDFQFQLWDTAGQEKFRSMTPLYYRGANIALIVYAVNDRSSFEEVDYWFQSIEQSIQDPIITIIVANKSDLEYEVRPEEGISKAEEYKSVYCEVSAKNMSGVSNLFDIMAEKVLSSVSTFSIDEPPLLIDSDTTQKKSNCC